MSKLVDAYLDSRTRDNGEGIPKMSDELLDPPIAPSIQMMVIDTYCVSRTLP
jgi:hypothetical protein